jgi:hypothetical protein
VVPQQVRRGRRVSGAVLRSTISSASALRLTRADATALLAGPALIPGISLTHPVTIRSVGVGTSSKTVHRWSYAGRHSTAVRAGRVLSSGLATVLATVTALAAAVVAVGDTVYERCR